MSAFSTVPAPQRTLVKWFHLSLVLALSVLATECCSPLWGQGGPPVGTEWQYEVRLEPLGENGSPTELVLRVYVAEVSTEELTLFWQTEGEGTAALPFPLRFGRWDYAFDTGSISQETAQAELSLGEREFRIDLPYPFLRRPEEAGAGSQWQVGPVRCEIVAQETIAGRRCDRIEMTHRLGRQATLWVELTTPRVVQLSQRVIVGRGDEFRLTYAFVQESQVDELWQPVVRDGLTAWQQALKKLDLSSSASDWAPSAETRQRLSDAFAALPPATDIKPSAAKLLQRVLLDAEQGLAAESRRAESVAQLRERIVGQQFPDFQLKTTTDETIRRADLRGKVVVLHFWKYRHENLAPPYGQVGFLDYVARRIDPEQVLVLGVSQVAADDGEVLRAQRQSARKLIEFMNLEYPVLLDPGRLLKQVGDPRDVQEPLPLWLVVGRDGRVVQHRVGLFDVDPLVGIEEVERWIKQAQERTE